jgi:hypothetical protein
MAWWSRYVSPKMPPMAYALAHAWRRYLRSAQCGVHVVVCDRDDAVQLGGELERHPRTAALVIDGAACQVLREFELAVTRAPELAEFRGYRGDQFADMWEPERLRGSLRKPARADWLVFLVLDSHRLFEGNEHEFAYWVGHLEPLPDDRRRVADIDDSSEQSTGSAHGGPSALLLHVPPEHEAALSTRMKLVEAWWNDEPRSPIVYRVVRTAPGWPAPE